MTLSGILIWPQFFTCAVSDIWFTSRGEMHERQHCARGKRNRPLLLPVTARENVDQFADLAPLLAFVAGRDRVLDAMGNVIGKDLIFSTA